MRPKSPNTTVRLCINQETGRVAGERTQGGQGSLALTDPSQTTGIGGVGGSLRIVD
jgi:hypothetical protein